MNCRIFNLCFQMKLRPTNIFYHRWDGLQNFQSKLILKKIFSLNNAMNFHDKIKFRSFDLKCRYYYSHNEKSCAALALSDFTKDGWSMAKSMVNLSLDHIIVAGNEF